MIEYCVMQTPIPLNFNYITSYLPNVDIYKHILTADSVSFSCDFYFSRHSDIKINKTLIGSNSGPVSLTIPIVKPKDKLNSRIDNLIISSHGNWEHTHWGAIYSSYGKAPFFEHLAPLLLPFYTNRFTDNFFLFCNTLNKVIEDFIMLPPNFYSKKLSSNINLSPYYQIWNQTVEKKSFIPSLSILDIAMHLGPEAFPHLLL